MSLKESKEHAGGIGGRRKEKREMLQAWLSPLKTQNTLRTPSITQCYQTQSDLSDITLYQDR